ERLLDRLGSARRRAPHRINRCGALRHHVRAGWPPDAGSASARGEVLVEAVTHADVVARVLTGSTTHLGVLGVGETVPGLVGAEGLEVLHPVLHGSTISSSHHLSQIHDSSCLCSFSY